MSQKKLAISNMSDYFNQTNSAQWCLTASDFTIHDLDDATYPPNPNKPYDLI